MNIQLALPKGRMYQGVRDLLADAGLRLHTDARGYRPILSLPGVRAKLLKPQDIVGMLEAGTRDLGFAGADWVAERDARVVQLLDTGLDPVRIVAAAPAGLSLARADLRIATEYTRLATAWIARRGLDARIVRSHGATEVFPPEDADAVVDNTATGATLRANGLEIVDELLRSSTRLYASRAALGSGKRGAIEAIVLLLRSVVEARGRVVIEVNVAHDGLGAVARLLPCMREPTVAQLHGGAGYAVKAAVPRAALPELIPALKRCGGSDILVSAIAQIVP